MIGKKIRKEGKKERLKEWKGKMTRMEKTEGDRREWSARWTGWEKIGEKEGKIWR